MKFIIYIFIIDYKDVTLLNMKYNFIYVLYNEICIIVFTKPYTINSNISYVYFTVYNYDIVNIYQ